MEISSFFFSLSFLEGAVVLKNRDGKRGIKKEILFIAVCCDEVRKKKSSSLPSLYCSVITTPYRLISQILSRHSA